MRTVGASVRVRVHDRWMTYAFRGGLGCAATSGRRSSALASSPPLAIALGLAVRHDLLARARRPRAPPHRGGAGRRPEALTRRTVKAVQGVAGEQPRLHSNAKSVAAALHALDVQRVYAALDLASARPTLYVASAAGASVARVLEKVSAVDPARDASSTRTRSNRTDPNGCRHLLPDARRDDRRLHHRVPDPGARRRPARCATGSRFVVAFALAASLALTLVEGPVHAPARHVPCWRVWGILALHILAVASFASVDDCADRPLGDRPDLALLRRPGQQRRPGARSRRRCSLRRSRSSRSGSRLGATVTALRDAIYYPSYQHARPLLVLAAWAGALFFAMLIVSHRRRTSPGA